MLKFAIIGCGRIAERHAENIVRVGQLTAVCDVVKEKAEALAKLSSAAVYTSLEALLAGEKGLDVVVICTPNGLHAEHTIKALQAGHHVLCEKPLCLTGAAAWQMVETAHLCRRKLFVVKQNRYNEPVQTVRRLLDEGRLGRIYSFQLNCFWHRPQAYYLNSWHGDPYLDGGTLYTQFSHYIDLLCWFLGEVDTVKGLSGNYAQRREFLLEDCGIALLKMKSGAIGSLHYTINSMNKNLEGSFALFGEKGSVKIGGQYLNELEWLETVDGADKPLPASGRANDYGYYQGSMSNHHRVYDDLLTSLAGGTALVEARDAVLTVETIQKIYAASERS